MSNSAPTPPCSRERIIELYFIEHRGRLLDIAAFLDRVARAPNPPAAGNATDFRIAAMRSALGILADDRPEKARRVLELWSDPTDMPIPSAGVKGAVGVCPPAGRSAS